MPRDLTTFPTRRSSDLRPRRGNRRWKPPADQTRRKAARHARRASGAPPRRRAPDVPRRAWGRSEEHTSELQSLAYLVCRLLLEIKKMPTIKKLATTQGS